MTCELRHIKTLSVSALSLSVRVVQIVLLTSVSPNHSDLPVPIRPGSSPPPPLSAESARPQLSPAIKTTRLSPRDQVMISPIIVIFLTSNDCVTRHKNTVSCSHACNIGSLFSFLAEKGHQPLVLFCLKRFKVGTEPSVRSISREQSLAVRAPRGNLFKSRVIAPRKSSLD